MQRRANEEDEVTKRLNILISLSLEASSGQQNVSTREKIYKLTDLGVSPADIARILRKPLNYVTANLHQRRSGKKTKRNE